MDVCWSGMSRLCVLLRGKENDGVRLFEVSEKLEEKNTVIIAKGGKSMQQLSENVIALPNADEAVIATLHL